MEDIIFCTMLVSISVVYFLIPLPYESFADLTIEQFKKQINARLKRNMIMIAIILIHTIIDLLYLIITH